MWIRSQNKEILVDAKMINIERGSGDYFIEGRTYFNNFDECFYLGFYKTKEKAVKVLNELQCMIAINGGVDSGMYQMPEDDE